MAEVGNEEISITNELEKKAAEESATILHKLQGDVNSHVSRFEKLHSEISDLKDAVKTYEEKYTASSEFKSFQEKILKDLEGIDETLKKETRKHVLAQAENEADKHVFLKTWSRHLHRYALEMGHSKFANQIELSEAERKEFSDFTSFEYKNAQSIFPEQKTLRTDNFNRGGSLVRAPDILMEIIDKAVQEVNPMLKVCRVRTTDRDQVEVSTITAHGSFSWVGETGTVSADTGLTTGLEQIPTHEAAVIYKATMSMLEDTELNLENELRTEYVENFDVGFGTGWTTGNGTMKPYGIMSDGNIGYRAQGHASLILNGDAITQMPFDLKDKYTRTAYFQMRRATMGSIATLKGGDGQYLLQPLGQTAQYVLKGYQVLPNPDMPAIASDAYPIIFGDFRNYLIVIKRANWVYIVDPFTSKGTSTVEFMLRRRVGGQPLVTEAFEKLKIATS